MRYLTKKLKHRIRILQAVETPNDDGGYTRSYKQLIRLWAAKKPVSDYIKAIRNTNADSTGIDTDEFKVRYNSAISKFNVDFNAAFNDGFNANKSQGMGRSFSIAFSSGFNSIIDFNPIKSEYFIFMEGANSYRGRLYKINAIAMDDENKEFIKLYCKQIEEQGTGAVIYA